MKKNIKFGLLFVFSLCVFLCSGIYGNANAQSMKLVIGQYECVSNSGCSGGQYCDVDTHKCVQACSVCPSCDDVSNTPDNPNLPGSPDSSELCDNGYLKLNSRCVECVSSADCPTEKPYCNVDKRQCESCNDKYPHWNGAKCTCKSGLYNLDGKCIQCISATDCPAEKPRCNKISFQCESCPSNAPVWNGKYCGCPTGEYSVDGKCLPLVECYTDQNCKYPKPVCNTTTGMCERCPDDSPDWDASRGVCSKKLTIRWNNMGTIEKTETIYRDTKVKSYTPSWKGFPFSYWAVSGGSKANFSQNITTNQTFYAFYGPKTSQSYTVDRSFCPINLAYGHPDQTITPDPTSVGLSWADIGSGQVTWKYSVKALYHAYNNDGLMYYSSNNAGMGTKYTWYTGGYSGESSVVYTDIWATGDNIRIFVHYDGWSHNAHQWWRLRIMATPYPQHPY